MIQILASKDNLGFDWVDLSAPTNEEIKQVAEQYALHEASIKDCMQPEHLPKYELFDHYTFVIFRVLAAENTHEADTIQELTNKISIFFTQDYLITVQDRKSVVSGKSVSVRVDSGGRGIIKKKKKT